MKLSAAAAAAIVLVSVLVGSVSVSAQMGEWEDAHATFYGGSDAAGTMGMST